MRTALLLAVFFAISSAAAPKRPQSKSTPMKTQQTKIEEARLRVDFPAAWSLARAPQPAEKAFVVTADGPRGADGASLVLSLSWYGPGNPFFKDLAAYLLRQTTPGPLPVKGEKTSPVQDAKAAGRPAKRFTRDTFETVPPGSLNAKAIPVKEEVLAAEHGGGFFVLQYRASAALFAKNLPAYERAAASLAPLP